MKFDFYKKNGHPTKNVEKHICLLQEFLILAIKNKFDLIYHQFLVMIQTISIEIGTLSNLFPILIKRNTYGFGF